MKKIFVLFAVLTLLNPMYSSSQDDKLPHNKKKAFHEDEKLDNPYLPNAFNNNKTSPAYRYKINNGVKPASSSSVYTIQVNVNSSGQNILGDAANEPNIAVNPVNPNNIVIGWRQFDNVTSNFRQAGWSYTNDGGLTWTFPGTIETGIFRSDPVLDFDTLGNFYYNSLTSDYTCKVFKSTNGGVAWNSGVSAGGGDKQWMAIDRTTGVGSGNIYAFWTSSYSTCLPGFFTRSSNGAGSFESCTAVNDSSYWGTMAVGKNGELYIAGAGLTDSVVIEKSTNAQVPASTITWQPPVNVFMDGYLNYGLSINPVGLVGQDNICVDCSNGLSSGYVYLLASVTRMSNSDSADVMFSRSINGGLTWSSPVRVNDDPSTRNFQWLATMSVAPNGRIDAIWLDTRDAPTGSDSSALYYSYSIDQGTTWSVNEKLSALFNPHVGYPNQNKMGDYYDMVSDNIGAHLAWSNTLNGEEDVYYSHIIPSIPSGVNEILDNETYSVYPNPTNGLFVISGKVKPSQIEIYNVLGEKVYSKTSFNTITEINISLQVAGIYYLKIVTQDGYSILKKLIKE